MNTGFKLFLQAVRLVLNNLGVALRISSFLYFLPAVLMFFVTGSSQPGEFSLPEFIVSIAAFVGGLWIAVAWHRFILLDEAPAGWLPGFDGRRIWSYFVKSLLIGVIALPLLMLLWAAVGGIGAVGGPVLVMVGGLLLLFVVLVLFYRVGSILPASSLDTSLRLRDAWGATTGATGSIVFLALASAVADFVFGLPGVFFATFSATLAFVWNAIVGWFSLLIGISVLTTLYGHYVEGRPLPE